MKFAVSQTSLAKAVSMVGKGLGTNSTLPILSGIYLRAAEGAVELQTNNLTTSVRCYVPANVEEAGETVVSGKVLSTIVKTLPDAAVEISNAEKTVALRCGKSKFSLNTLSVADWSSFPEVKEDDSVELPAELLTAMVGKVYKVTSKESSRPILQGILLTVEDNTIRLVATDSFRLAVCDSAVETQEGQKFRTIVPGTVFHDVLSMTEPGDAVRIGIASNQAIFSFGNTTFVSRRIEGNFPDYKQLLPPSCATALSLGVEDFSGALKRVSAVAQQNSSVRLDIDPAGELVRLSASSPELGEAVEDVSAAIEGSPLAIALNYRYVLDCMGAISDASDLRLELQSSTQPGIFKVNGKINYLYLLMPVRL